MRRKNQSLPPLENREQWSTPRFKIARPNGCATRQGDPYEVAREIRVKSEAVMRQAGVV
jgi:hypothetical protein